MECIRTNSDSRLSLWKLKRVLSILLLTAIANETSKPSEHSLAMSENETFGYLTFPKFAPEKAIGDFLQSQLEEQAVKKYPQWDYPRTEPLVTLVAAKRNLHQSELDLTEKRQDAVGQREALNVQWTDLENEAVKFKEKFCEFDKMINENAQKRERAIAKREQQKILQNEWDKAITDLRQQHTKLTKIRDSMENQIRDHSIYEEYLQMVAEEHPDYNTPEEVFKKFGALDEARNTLTERLDENLTALENLKDKMLGLMKTQNSQLIGMNNRLASLYDRYAAAKSNAQGWEKMVQRIQNESGEKLIEILNVRKACWNIYLDMCKRRKMEPKFDKSDFENHLWFIRKTILKLKKTVEIAHQKTTTEVSSVCVERPKSKRRI